MSDRGRSLLLAIAVLLLSAAPAAADGWEPVVRVVRGPCPTCAVKVRSGPGTSYAVQGTVATGRTVVAACRVFAETVVTASGRSTRWARLADGGWISAVYLRLPAGVAPAPLPDCEGVGDEHAAVTAASGRPVAPKG